MPRSSFLVCAVVLGAAFFALSAQAPQPVPTPPATSSADCPLPEADTHKFLSSAAIDVAAPRGRLALVPVTTEAARERGLMCVVRVPLDRGMIFVFAPPERPQGFWMKNTLVSLDMVFVTSAGIVSTVAANVPATQRGTADNAVARRAGLAQYVIELAAGDAARHGIVHGTKLALPTLTAAE